MEEVVEILGAKVLVIDDEKEICRLIKVGLTALGFAFLEAGTGKDGIYQVAMAKPDLIILDMSLPDMDGLEVVKQIREWSAIPIIILSVRGREKDKIDTLDAGADDYITKPFGMGELLARIRAALRHQPNLTKDATIQSGDLVIDLLHRQVKLANLEVKFTPTEYEIIKILALNKGKVVTHKHLLSSIWGDEFQKQTQYLRIYISQIRKKIESDPDQPRLIITEPAIGYRMVDPYQS